MTDGGWFIGAWLIDDDWLGPEPVTHQVSQSISHLANSQPKTISHQSSAPFRVLSSRTPASH
jgi:hypothetical protein